MENSQYIEAKNCYLANPKESIASIALKLNINRKSLSKYLKKQNLYSGRKYDKETINMASKMLSTGKGITEIAKSLNVNRVSLSRELVKQCLYQKKNNFDSKKYETDKMLNMIDDYINKNLSKKC